MSEPSLHPQVVRSGEAGPSASSQRAGAGGDGPFDVVIVGGGSTGCVLATRLTEDPSVSVLLIEAGDIAANPVADRLAAVDFSHTGRDWGFSAVGAGGATVPYPQGRALGGGSSVNGATALRGMPDDYDGWAAAGSPLWSWESLLPSFRRLESDPLGGRWHGTDGPIPIARWGRDELIAPQQAFLGACAAQGWDWIDDHNDPTVSGVGSLPMNRRDGLRMSTAICYLRPVLDRSNLTVWGGARALRLILDQARVTAVEVEHDGRVQRVSGGEIVVSAGAINSAALLLRSGIGDPPGILRHGIPVAHELHGVGQNLMEHPGSMVLVVPRPGAVDLDDLQFQLAARYTSSPGAPVNDVQLSMMNHWDLRPVPELRQVVGHDLVFAITCGYQAPRSRGSVSLAGGP